MRPASADLPPASPARRAAEPREALAELQRQSQEFKRTLDGLVGSYDRHLELLSAAVAGQSSLEDDGGGLSPSRRDPGSPVAAQRVSSYSMDESRSLEPDSNRGRADEPEDEGVTGRRPSIGVDVRELWQRGSQAKGDEVLPSQVDFMRQQVSGHEWVPKKRSSVFSTTRSRIRSSFRSSRGCLEEHTGTKHWSIAPESPVHMIWTLFSLILIAYDFLTLPLVVSFDIDGVLFGRLNLIGSVFWTVDIGIQFATGYYKVEFTERRLRVIAKRYFRTWFPLDALVVGTDWICIILDMYGWSHGAGVAKLAKVPRFARALKVFKVFDQAGAILVSSTAGALADNFRFFLVIVGFTHFVACGWHFLGSWQQAYHMSWLDHEGLDGTGVLYLYVVSFQWSLSQFTPGANPYHARNTAEWLYTSMVLFFGLVIYSSFLGSITSSLTHLRSQTLDHYRHEKQLREYLQRNRVSAEICNKMRDVKRYRYIGGKYMPTFSDLQGIAAFPRSLLAEIKWSVYSNCIRYHPLFNTAIDVSAGVVHKICAEAVSEFSYMWGHELFRVGCPAKHMLFVKRGCLAYSTQKHDLEHLSGLSLASFAGVGATKLMRHLTTLTPGRRDSAGPKEDPDTLFIRPGRGENACVVSGRFVDQYPWICEVALWCVWTHHGTLLAKDNCTVLALTPDSLYATVATDLPMLQAFRCYALAFASELGEDVSSSTQETYISIVNDYWGGDGAHEWADKALTKAREEFARIESQMLGSASGKSASIDV